MKVLVLYAHPNPRSFTHAILDRFTAGLADRGHDFRVNDLYANHFDPVYRVEDFAFFMHDSVPRDVLEGWNLPATVLEVSGRGVFGPVKKFLAKRWLRGKDVEEIARAIARTRPKDVLEEQEKVAWADGLAVIAPNYWMHFPAILKGWVTRVFTYGFAYTLTPDGWRGDVNGRIPQLKLRKALILQPTFFSEKDYDETGLEAAMRKTIDMWGFVYPGVEEVQREFFYAVTAGGTETRTAYLQKAYELGRDY